MNRTLMAALLATAVAAPGALATQVKFNQVLNAVNVGVSQVGGYTGTVQAGFYEIQVGNPGSPFKSFCVDLYDFSGTAYQNYTQASLKNAPQSSGNSDIAMGTVGANAVKTLWAMYYSAALGNSTTAAALQVAIWEAVNDADVGLNLGAGSFKVTSTGAVITEAGAMLNAIAGYSGSLPDLFAWVNTTDATHYQDYIGVPDGGATLMLLGMGLCGLASVYRRNSK